jgi:hypothetical protein
MSWKKQKKGWWQGDKGWRWCSEVSALK